MHRNKTLISETAAATADENETKCLSNNFLRFECMIIVWLPSSVYAMDICQYVNSFTVNGVCLPHTVCECCIYVCI